MNLRIYNGRVVDAANGIDKITDLYIAGERIAAIGQAPPGFKIDKDIDASDLVVAPGLVDLAAALREPGHEHKATIASETAAAAAGGITTLCCSPDTDPAIDSPAEVRLVHQQAASAGSCRVLPIGGLTAGLHGEQLSEMAALKDAGCVGVGNALRPLKNSLILRRALEYAASHELTVFLHPMDHELADGGCAHEGAVSTRLGLPGIPAAAETAALGQQLALIEQTGVRAHICRLSAARSVEMVARAIDEGLNISADVCAHQLHLTEQDIGDYNSLCHTLPPLRSAADRDGLRAALAQGTVAAICSDHQPHEIDAKQSPFQNAEPGISALETLLPLTLEMVTDGLLSLSDTLAKITSEPARLLNLEAGTLSPGKPADICIFSTNQPWELKPEALHSRGKNTPFGNRTFKTRVTHTLLGGKFVFQASTPSR